MDFRNRFGHFLCRCGVHSYSPDVQAGYPYQTCDKCGKLSIYRPTVTSALSPARF